tara:strand:- start:11 stop:460 length:450 start_codon:yes stop_codon:yes gene_type:complete
MSFLDSLGIVAQPKWVNGQDVECTVTVEASTSTNGTKQFRFTFVAVSGASIDVYSSCTQNAVGVATARLRPLIGLGEDEKITLSDLEKIHAAKTLSSLSATMNIRTRMERDGQYTRTIVEVYEPVGATTKAENAAKELNKADNASSVPF